MQADIGVYGLAVMGSNLARNLASRGIAVAIHNRSADKTLALAAEHPEANFIVANNDEEFIASLKTPRTVLIMVKAGQPTDAVIDNLSALMQPGDIIVDGGNALYTDTIRRERALREKGIHFVGLGVSGGEVGALEGPSLMPGGSEQAYDTLGPMFRKIAAQVDGEPCVTHIGSDGAGHFVKMVHNGIEYADMQIIAESYDLLRRLTGKSAQQIGEIFSEWNQGELESYLVEVTSQVLAHTDAKTGKPFVDVVLDQAGAKGTGAWTGQNALELGVAAGAITEAVFARSLSGMEAQRLEARSIARPAVTPEGEEFVETVRNALYAAKILAYSQGFDIIGAGAENYGWKIDRGSCARIWRGGCIIRARFLERITEAYAANPALTGLMFSEDFAKEIAARLPQLRQVVATAVKNAIPVPVFSSLLAYIDGLSSERLPASLIQAQRDNFGAHTYRRVDAPGVYHTLWSGDQSEVQE